MPRMQILTEIEREESEDCGVEAELALVDEVVGADAFVLPEVFKGVVGKIIKTRFILRYLDDVAFRQAIEKQLNKGESSNKFSRAISFGNATSTRS